jgi:HAE1 family hydrophobic/amphiphilic exporter-1
MRVILKSLFLSLVFVCSSLVAQAQTPQPTPTPSADDILKNLKARPLPPMPDLKRIGVDNSNVMTISMNDAIRKALENNNDIEIAKDDVRLNENTLRALDGVYDPVFTFNPRFTDSTQDTGQVFSGATSSTIKQRSLQTNADWTKILRKGGGSYTVFFNSTRDTSNSSLFTTSYRPTLGITFTQPLWRGRKIDNNRRQISIQKKRLEQSDADFRRRTIEVITQVQRAYWDLVFALRDQQNKLENLNLTRENLRQVEAKIAAGSSAPLNRAEVQTELANREADVLVATQSVSIAENTLKSLLFRDSSGAEWSASITPTDRPDPNLQSFSLTDALKDAIDNRPELNRLKLEKEINAIDVEYFKDQTKPKIDFNATFSLNGLAGTPRTPNRAPFQTFLIDETLLTADSFLLRELRRLSPTPIINPTITVTPSIIPNKLIGGYGQALGNLFKFDTRSFEFGATITLPWKNQVAKANLAGARIQEDRLNAQMRQQEQLIVVEVRNAVQAVETSRLRLQASRIARENAEIQLAGEQKLYQVGRSTTFLLFQRENALANARNAELRAETDYNKALADLQKATSTTLRINNVTIESPMK